MWLRAADAPRTAASRPAPRGTRSAARVAAHSASRTVSPGHLGRKHVRTAGRRSDYRHPPRRPVDARSQVRSFRGSFGGLIDSSSSISAGTRPSIFLTRGLQQLGHAQAQQRVLLADHDPHVTPARRRWPPPPCQDVAPGTRSPRDLAPLLTDQPTGGGSLLPESGEPVKKEMRPFASSTARRIWAKRSIPSLRAAAMRSSREIRWTRKTSPSGSP